MTPVTRVISHRDGVPIYQYRTDPGTSPVSVHRPGHPASTTRRTGPSHPRFPGALVRAGGGPGVRRGRGRGARPASAGLPGRRGRRVLRPHRARRGRAIAVAGLARRTRCSSRSCTDTRAGYCGWRYPRPGDRCGTTRSASIETELIAGAGGLSTGGPGAPDAAADRARAPGPRRGGRSAAQR